jgi:hypothetical protein
MGLAAHTIGLAAAPGSGIAGDEQSYVLINL